MKSRYIRITHYVDLNALPHMTPRDAMGTILNAAETSLMRERDRLAAAAARNADDLAALSRLQPPY